MSMLYLTTVTTFTTFKYSILTLLFNLEVFQRKQSVNRINKQTLLAKYLNTCIPYICV